MYNLLRHPLAKPVGTGLLQLGVLIAWGCDVMRWFLERYLVWVFQQTQGLSPSAMVPAALALGLGGAVVVLVTIQLPPIAVAIAGGVAQRLARGRGDA